MTIPTLLLVLALISMAWYVLTTIRISSALQKRGEKINWPLIRLMAPFYAGRLRKLRIEETGGSGSLFYQWVLSVNLALVLVLAAVIVYYA